MMIYVDLFVYLSKKRNRIVSSIEIDIFVEPNDAAHDSIVL